MFNEDTIDDLGFYVNEDERGCFHYISCEMVSVLPHVGGRNFIDIKVEIASTMAYKV